MGWPPRTIVARARPAQFRTHERGTNRRVQREPQHLPPKERGSDERRHAHRARPENQGRSRNEEDPGQAVALCRGGSFNEGGGFARNTSGTSSSPVILRDYLAPWNNGTQGRPIMRGVSFDPTTGVRVLRRGRSKHLPDPMQLGLHRRLRQRLPTRQSLAERGSARHRAGLRGQFSFEFTGSYLTDATSGGRDILRLKE
jgi:hypothetical protein